MIFIGTPKQWGGGKKHLFFQAVKIAPQTPKIRPRPQRQRTTQHKTHNAPVGVAPSRFCSNPRVTRCLTPNNAVELDNGLDDDDDRDEHGGDDNN